MQFLTVGKIRQKAHRLVSVYEKPGNPWLSQREVVGVAALLPQLLSESLTFSAGQNRRTIINQHQNGRIK